MDGKSMFKVTTRKNDSAPEVTTAVTVDWSGLTDEMAKAIMAGALVIKAQGAWRRKGIPATATLIARDLTPGKRVAEVVTLDTERERIKHLTPAERDAIAEQIIAERAMLHPKDRWMQDGSGQPAGDPTIHGDNG